MNPIRSNWTTPGRYRIRRLPAEVAGWLLDPGSLTARLQDRCREGFRVEVLRLAWERPRHDEARALKIPPSQRALVREVRLLCGDRPWVFARTLIPRASLRGSNRRLQHLGNRPLGAFLFANPRLRRGALEIACLPPDDPLHVRALAGAVESSGLWGRRSLFWLEGMPLLVAEFFLPGLIGGRSR